MPSMASIFSKPLYITYGTNSEFGFDYLRDNMVTRVQALGVAAPLHDAAGELVDDLHLLSEDAEFRQIYKLPVMAIPPNKPVIRVDENDLVYRTIDGKLRRCSRCRAWPRSSQGRSPWR